MTYQEKALIMSLERQVKELTARVEALEAKPKRGRPPKRQANGEETTNR